jgi:hypothetical protein
VKTYNVVFVRTAYESYARFLVSAEDQYRAMDRAREELFGRAWEWQCRRSSEVPGVAMNNTDLIEL